MPLYEYRCRSCGEQTEVLQRLADAPLAACPRCGGPVEKLASAPALQFKGSGWYVTDYPKKSAGGGSAAANEKADAGAAKGQEKTTPAAKDAAGSSPTSDRPAKPSS